MGTVQHADVAVVILNWNGQHHLETYLPSVLEHTPSDTRVWVVDNGSTDDSVAWLLAHHSPRVELVELDQNLGFAAGYNEGLKHIDAQVYVLLNSDVRMDGPWVEPVLAAMDEHGWDVASPLLVQDIRPSMCEHAGAAGGWMDKDGYPFCLGRLFESVEPVDAWLAQNREVFWASGACFFIRKEAWLHAEGFDGSLFAHMEEIDLCWRLKNEGKRVGCVGTVKVRHLGGGTLQTTSPFKTYLNFRKQPRGDAEKPRRILACVHVQAHDLGWDCSLENACRWAMASILGCGSSPWGILPAFGLHPTQEKGVAALAHAKSQHEGMVAQERHRRILPSGSRPRTRLEVAWRPLIAPFLVRCTSPTN